MAGEGLGDQARDAAEVARIGAVIAAYQLAGLAGDAYRNRQNLVNRATGVLERGRDLVEGAQGFVDDTVRPIAEATEPIVQNPLVVSGMEVAGKALGAVVEARLEGRPIDKGVGLKAVRAVGTGLVRYALNGGANAAQEGGEGT